MERLPSPENTGTPDPPVSAIKHARHAPQPHANAPRFRGLVRLARPHQWTKNLLCFAGVFFSGHIGELPSVLRAFLTFLVFCAASSSVYVLNDLLDKDRDQNHPRKRLRPIPAGEVSPFHARIFGGVLGAAVYFLVLYGNLNLFG